MSTVTHRDSSGPEFGSPDCQKKRRFFCTTCHISVTSQHFPKNFTLQESYVQYLPEKLSKIKETLIVKKWLAIPCASNLVRQWKIVVFHDNFGIVKSNQSYVKKLLVKFMNPHTHILKLYTQGYSPV